MSYNGTVYCGYCGNRGHNKLGCPVRKENAENSDYLKREIEREKQRREYAVAKRVCSYCKEPGHNRRKCAVMVDDRETIRVDTAFARKRVLNSMRQNGIGRGALVRTYFNSLRERPILHVVEDIRWDHLDDGLLYNQTHQVRRGYARDFMTTRIASVASLKDYEPQHNSWRQIPKVGDRSFLNRTHLASIMPSAVPPLLGGYAGNFDGEYTRGAALADTSLIASVECWSQEINPPPDWREPLTLTHNQALHWHFSFPDHGADVYDKMRAASSWQAREELECVKGWVK